MADRAVPTDAPVPSPARRSGWAAALFVLLTAAHLVPVWRVARFPSQDGPEHAYNAVILHDYGRPDATQFRRYFVVSRRPVPNWATHLILDGLLYVVRPAVADKLVVSGYLVLFCAAAYYCGRGVGSPAGWGGLLLLPLAYNVFLFLGFYNFDYSLAALLLAVGYWARHVGRFGRRSITVLTLWVTVVYLCHIVAFVIAAAVVAAGVAQEVVGVAATGPLLVAAVAALAVAVAFAFGGPVAAAGVLLAAVIAAILYLRRSPPPMDWPAARHRLRRAAAPLIAVLPAAVLSAAFVVGERGHPRGEAAAVRLTRLFDWSRTFVRADAAVSASVMAVLGVATVVALVRRRRRRQPWVPRDALLAAAVGTAALTFVSPAALSGGSYVVDRVGLLAALLWAAWVAGQMTAGPASPFSRLGRLALGGFAVAATVALVTRDAAGMSARAGLVSEYVAAAAVLPPDTPVLAVEYAEGTPAGRPGDDGGRVAFMVHALGWTAADHRDAEVANYEAVTGYFPILFRPDVAFRPQHETVAPSDYVRGTAGHGRVDYVVLWTGGHPPGSAANRRTAADLAANYHEVARSPGRGWCVVYARNGLGTP